LILKELAPLTNFLVQLSDDDRDRVLPKITLFSECDTRVETLKPFKTKDWKTLQKYDPDFVRMEFD
jgi:hypothetical protein